MNDLDQLFEEYQDKALALIEQLFNNDVKPILERNGWRFISGNGSWWIYTQTDRISSNLDSPDDYPDNPELQNLMQYLSASVPGFPHNDLGSLMPSLDPDSVLTKTDPEVINANKVATTLAALKDFSLDELAAADFALLGYYNFGKKISFDNIAYTKLLDKSLIDKDGLFTDTDSLSRAIAIEVSWRLEG